MRGIGQTTNLIDNLPDGRCAIVVPYHNIGSLVKKAIENERGKDFAKSVKIFSIKEEEDVAQMLGYGYLVFFDNSFIDAVNNQEIDKETAKKAFWAAHSCAIIYRRGKNK